MVNQGEGVRNIDEGSSGCGLLKNINLFLGGNPMVRNNSNEALIPRLSQGKIKLIVMTLALSVLVAAITVDMVNPALPLIGEQLGASKARISWVVSGVALILAIGVPLYGRMSDFFDLKKLFIIAVGILSSGSLICALAPNLIVLVAGRMIQGAGMAAIPVLSVVAVSKVLPPNKESGGRSMFLAARCWG